MIARLFLRLAILLAASCAVAGCAQESARDWPEPAPALWQVTSPAGQDAWLFGTVHALPADLDWGTPLLDDTFENAGVLVVEIANLDAAYGSSLISQLATTPGQPPLPTRVDPDERPALRALMDDAGMDSEDFDDVETWAAALMLSGAVRIGDPGRGVDRTLIAHADNIVGLETYGQQLALFDHLSEEAQSDLLHGVAEAHAIQSEETMLTSWVTGDAEAMGEQVNLSLQDSPELRRVLLVDRNRNWTGQITRMIDAGQRPFVAVGAGHLSGADSVVEMLEAAGYGTRRIQ